MSSVTEEKNNGIKFSLEGVPDSSRSPEKSVMILELGDTLLSAALFVQNTNEIFLLKDYLLKGNSDVKKAEALQEIISKQEVLQKSYRKILLTYINSFATLVPNALYKSEEKENYLRFNQDIPNDAVFFADEVSKCDAKLVYAVPASIKSKTDYLFPAHQARHYISVLIDSIFTNHKSKSHTFYIHIHETHFDLLLFTDKLEFFNTFSYQSSEDILYFVLACYSQNNCDVETVPLKILGSIEVQSPLHQILLTYIKKVEAIVPSHRPFKTASFVSIPEHHYFTLFSRLFCE